LKLKPGDSFQFIKGKWYNYIKFQHAFTFQKFRISKKYLLYNYLIEEIRGKLLGKSDDKSNLVEMVNIYKNLQKTRLDNDFYLTEGACLKVDPKYIKLTE